MNNKEIREYVDGNVTYDEAVETLKKNTRNFAKRTHKAHGV